VINMSISVINMSIQLNMSILVINMSISVINLVFSHGGISVFHIEQIVFSLKVACYFV
jgi:hypothetical protein